MSALAYLYEFEHKAPSGEVLAVFRGTSAAGGVEHDGHTWMSIVVKHSGVKYSQQETAGQVTLTVESAHPVAGLFELGSPAGSVRVRVYEHDAGGTVCIYAGRVRSATHNPPECALLCTTGSERLGRVGLRYNTGAVCQHALYSPACGLDRATATSSAQVVAVSPDGLTIATDSPAPAADLQAGVLTWGAYAASILGNDGSGGLTLFHALPGLAAGATVSLSRGCNRSAARCQALANYDNFSGFDGFPTPKNPFTTGLK